MIRFDLHCEEDHEFDCWFSSSKDFDDQQAHHLLACPICESTKITKALMAPSVSVAKRGEAKIPVASAVHSEMIAKLRQLKQEIEKNAENVGEKFPEEARKIHYGETQARGIYGKASLEEAAGLAEEGIEFLPIPELPEEKN